MDERLRVVQGDIAKQEVEVVVNAANSRLQRGGGVDGAIHRGAGVSLQEHLDGIGGCNTGEAVTTPGFRLPAKHIVHAVGPVWNGGAQDEEALLASAYRAAFREARQVRARTIALPALSTGAFGFPVERATEIAVREAQAALAEDPRLREIRFVCFDDRTEEAYHAALGERTERAAGGA